MLDDEILKTFLSRAPGYFKFFNFFPYFLTVSSKNYFVIYF